MSICFPVRFFFLILVLGSSLARAAWLEPTLVRDINTNNNGSSPMYMTPFGSNLLFRATTDEGTSTWVTDGTVAGTAPMTFIELGSGAAEVNGQLIFARFDSAGVELWTSDGSSNGTAMVKDIAPGGVSGFVSFLGASSNSFYFVGNDEEHGKELWRSDGTSNGTRMVKDIVPGSASSFPAFTLPGTVVDGRLWFYADDGTNGTRPWLSDGTENGTIPIVVPGNSSSSLWSTRAVGGLSNLIFFTATTTNYGSELWVADGTEAGTRLVLDINPGDQGSATWAGATLNGAFLFFGDDGYTSGRHGMELWQTDGTEDGTTLVKDIAPGPNSGAWNLSMFTFKGFVYFFANDGTGFGLWRSDGTQSGTTLVRHMIAPGVFYYPDSFVVLGDSFYFHNGTELWKSDGTADGTVQIGNAEAGSRLYRAGNSIVFAGLDPRFGREPWTSDGTSNGTVMLLDLNTAPADSLPGLFAEANGRVFFGASQREYEGHTGLWKTDLNGSDAELVAPWRVLNLVSWSNRVAALVTASNGFDLELWQTDGLTTELVKPLGFSFSYEVMPMLHVNGTVFVLRRGLSDNELWTSDGTSNGTYVVWQGPFDGRVDRMVLFDGKAYFTQNNSLGGATLWKSDGTSNGTAAVKTFTNHTELAHLTAVSDKLFFVAPADGGLALYKSDGTESGTMLVTLLLTPYPRDRVSLVAGGNVLFFTFLHYQTGGDLWRSDGTAAGTFMVKDIFPSFGGQLWPAVSDMSYAGGTLYFRSTRPLGQNLIGLWKSDGTSNGTVLVSSVSAGPVTQVNGLGFFQGNSALDGTELFITDGTSNGTRALTDLQPANAYNVIPALPLFAASNGRIFFSGRDTSHGTELWTLNVPPMPRIQKHERIETTSTLAISGASGLTNVVESSIDLIQWSAFATNRIPESGVLSVQDTNGGGRAFYRARQLMP